MCLYVYFGFCHAATRCTLQLAGVCGGTAKNHPESPGKNHVTYTRKAVPVITGYGLSTSLSDTLSMFCPHGRTCTHVPVVLGVAMVARHYPARGTSGSDLFSVP